MVLFIILGVTVFITFVVVGVLFYMLNKEGQKKQEAVPVTDLEQLKKELSNQVFEPSGLKIVEEGQDVIPVFQPKVSFPVVQEPPQEPPAPVQSSIEDEAYKKRAQMLEDELLAISKKADGQSDEARQMIENLTKENEMLKSQLAEETSRVNAAEAELNREKEALRQDLEALKYELIKAKAQSSGLERVSFNYKNQLEDFFKKINAVQVTNDQLSQVKNRLEGMVEEVKSQNEELAKKDQLAQFELEKNRSRLLALEREYEQLKAQQQKGPQA